MHENLGWTKRCFVVFWHVDRETSFRFKNGPKTGPKTDPNRVQNGFRRVLNEDPILKCEKSSAKFTGTAGSGAKLERLDPVWGGKQGGDTIVFTRLMTPREGSADYQKNNGR